MGEPDQVALRAALEEAGWSVERIDSDAWWAHEIWRLQSTWRPQSAVAYVTFLVTPDIDTRRTSAFSDVWFIAVSRDVPQERREHGRTEFSVTPWPKRLRQVVEAASALRPAP